MKFLTSLIAAALLLSGCSSNNEEVPQGSSSVPIYCDQTKVLAAFPDSVPNPKYIATDWEPAEGTDLFAAYNAGGIACSYGIQEAEIGATILWAPDYGMTFSGLEEGWKSSGQTVVDLPGLDEEKAYVLTEGEAGKGEYHVWKINLLINGFWIQVGATFFGSIDDAMPIVKAAVDSILTPDQAEASNIKGCYFTQENLNVLVMDITYHDNTTVSARIGLQPYQKDTSTGEFLGTFENGILHGIYTFKSEGSTSERELYFKRDGKNFLPATGPVEIIDNKLERFQRPLQLAWDKKNTYSPGEDCATVIKGME